MKKINLFIAITIVCFTKIYGQDIPDLEFPYTGYYLADDLSLKKLEKVQGNFESKTGTLGYGLTNYLTVFKTTSDVRFSKTKMPRIFINTAGMDPSEYCTLIKADIKKKKRWFIQSKNSAYDGGKLDVSEFKIKIDFKKIRDGQYEVILPKDILIGEYAIIVSIYASCFGIDE